MFYRHNLSDFFTFSVKSKLARLSLLVSLSSTVLATGARIQTYLVCGGCSHTRRRRYFRVQFSGHFGWTQVISGHLGSNRTNPGHSDSKWPENWTRIEPTWPEWPGAGPGQFESIWHELTQTWSGLIVIGYFGSFLYFLFHLELGRAVNSPKGYRIISAVLSNIYSFFLCYLICHFSQNTKRNSSVAL